MKKLLSLAFCAAAATSFAADEITLGDEIGVIRIELANGQENTIIAASFKDLETGGDISVANLVKTTNLETGAQIIRYKADGTHEAWILTESKTWEKAAATLTQGADGETTTGTGDDPSTTAPTVGEGLWIVRGDNPTGNAVIALYGKYSEGRTSSYVSEKWNLLGNAGTEAYTFTTGMVGDKVVVARDGALRQYEYDETKGWYYPTYTTETVTILGNAQKVVSETKNTENPNLAPGEGFWYYTKQPNGSLTWKDVQ